MSVCPPKSLISMTVPDQRRPPHCRDPPPLGGFDLLGRASRSRLARSTAMCQPPPGQAAGPHARPIA